MRIGNRNFPYPVLNAKQDLSDYFEYCRFFLWSDSIDEGAPIYDGSDCVLKDAYFFLTNKYLKNLYSKGIIKGSIIVDCPSGCYRRSFEISDTPQDIRIPSRYLKGTVSISCFLYAVEDIPDFAPTQLQPLYDDLSFYIDKFDIVAADDGFDFTVDRDELFDNRTASIFTIVKNDTLDGLIKYENLSRNIVIQLPDEQYACYDNMKMHSAYNDISFAMIAIPVLAGCLSDIQKEIYDNGEEDFLEVLDRHDWFNSVLYSYKRLTESELDFDTFVDISSYELAQTVLNGASCKGLVVFNDILVGGLQNDEDENEANYVND